MLLISSAIIIVYYNITTLYARILLQNMIILFRNAVSD